MMNLFGIYMTFIAVQPIGAEGMINMIVDGLYSKGKLKVVVD